jgi:hypothetical protein
MTASHSDPCSGQLVHVATRIFPLIGARGVPTILDEWSANRKLSQNYFLLTQGGTAAFFWGSAPCARPPVMREKLVAAQREVGISKAKGPNHGWLVWASFFWPVSSPIALPQGCGRSDYCIPPAKALVGVSGVLGLPCLSRRSEPDRVFETGPFPHIRVHNIAGRILHPSPPFLNRKSGLKRVLALNVDAPGGTRQPQRGANRRMT